MKKVECSLLQQEPAVVSFCVEGMMEERRGEERVDQKLEDTGKDVRRGSRTEEEKQEQYY